MNPIELYNRSLDYLGIDDRQAVDEPHAFQLNKQAAFLGNRDAILAMGWFLLNGRGVEKDIALARSWYRKSARHGNPRAMFSLGWISYDELAFYDAGHWFRKAAGIGHARSLYWLGKMNWRGHGFPLDRSAAFALFHQAARKHDPEAIRALRFLSRSRPVVASPKS